MPVLSRRWEIAPPVPDFFLAAFPDLHRVVAQVLYNRGLTEPAQARAFLAAEGGLDDPFLLKGVADAVERITHAIRKRERIAIYGDFDTDGVTATALLALTLEALGAQVQAYIPHRIREGYGLNIQALDELAGSGVGLVVTVDCGVRSPNEIAHARQRGMDVVVTDHHAVVDGSVAPLEAVAVVNPHQPDCPYPYKDLAGVGLAYKLAQALLRSGLWSPPALQEDDLLDLVALGTVADLAPLTGENRTLVTQGLERLNREPRPGVAALMRQAGLRPGSVDATAIGYALGPRLNAAGRIAHAQKAFLLLTTQYPAEAERLAQQLDDLNRERQRITSEVQERAREVAQVSEAGRPLLFIADPEFPAGVVGLVASRLVEEFYRPAAIVEWGEEYSRGSARSIPEFHITRALDACADLLLRHGGHAAAAGFTAPTEALPALKERLLALAAQELGGRYLIPSLRVDAQVGLQEMNGSLWKALQLLRPFGEGNPEPVFLSRNVQVRSSRAVGAEGTHLRLLLSDGRAVWDCIAFQQGGWYDRLPERIDVVYHLQQNEWGGERRLQLNIQDLRPAGLDDPLTPLLPAQAPSHPPGCDGLGPPDQSAE